MSRFGDRRLLIAPVWNWNLSFVVRGFATHTFNRTSLELKHVWESASDEELFPLLIAPVWNWNSIEPCQILLERWTFNRTSLELKHANAGRITETERSTFNRTSLELKHGRLAIENLVGWHLLIAPVWNWNADWRDRCFCPVGAFNRTSLELKHWTAWYTDSAVPPFNRTSLELKHRFYKPKHYRSSF